MGVGPQITFFGVQLCHMDKAFTLPKTMCSQNPGPPSSEFQLIHLHVLQPKPWSLPLSLLVATTVTNRIKIHSIMRMM